MNTLYKSALAIAIIGCVNWGLVGLLNFNLVEKFCKKLFNIIA